MKPDLSTPEGRFFKDVWDKIIKKGGGALTGDKCTSKNFGQYDILIFSPDQLDDPTLKIDDIRPIVDAVDDGAFIKFEIYSRSDFEAEVQKRKDAIAADEARRAQEVLKAKEDFQNRDPDAISAIYFKTQGAAVCVGVPSDNPLVNLLKRSDSPFADLSKGGIFRQIPDLNAIFLSIKKNECSAVIAPTKLLRDQLIPPLNRDNVVFDVHPGEIPASAVNELGGEK